MWCWLNLDDCYLINNSKKKVEILKKRIKDKAYFNKWSLRLRNQFKQNRGKTFLANVSFKFCQILNRISESLELFHLSHLFCIACDSDILPRKFVKLFVLLRGGKNTKISAALGIKSVLVANYFFWRSVQIHRVCIKRGGAGGDGRKFFSPWSCLPSIFCSLINHYVFDVSFILTICKSCLCMYSFHLRFSRCGGDAPILSCCRGSFGSNGGDRRKNRRRRRLPQRSS